MRPSTATAVNASCIKATLAGRAYRRHMTTKPGDELDPTQPFSLSDLIDDDDQGVSLDAAADDEGPTRQPPPPEHP